MHRGNMQHKSSRLQFVNRFSRLRKLPRHTHKQNVTVQEDDESQREELSELYENACNELNIKCNSELKKALHNEHVSINGLTVLDLSSNYLGNKGVLPLIKILHQAKYLKEINLSQNGLRNKSIVSLCEALKYNYHEGGIVSDVILSNNCISHEAAVALKELLLENRNITHLELSNTKIDLDERAEIQEYIEQNRLDKSNYIHDDNNNSMINKFVNPL